MADNRRYEAPKGRHAATLETGQADGIRPGVRKHNPHANMPYSPSAAPDSPQTSGAYYGFQRSGDKKKKQKGSWPWRIVFWVALVVFIGSLVGLGAIGLSYFQGQSTYKGIEDLAGFTLADAADTEGLSLADMSVDWAALKAVNPDTVGWIYMPGTVVNYPIVHTTNNDKYLTTDFRGGQGWLANFGTVFLSAENAADFSDANNIVYGHHMNDGSMFACISTFANADEFNSHRTVFILTPQGNYRLTTFSLVLCEANDPLAQTAFASEEEMTSYIQDKMNRSLVAPSPAADPATGMERIFAFVTCDYTVNDGRAVLFASVVETTVPDGRTLLPDQEGQGMVAPDDIAIVEDAVKEIG